MSYIVEPVHWLIPNNPHHPYYACGVKSDPAHFYAYLCTFTPDEFLRRAARELAGEVCPRCALIAHTR